MNAREIAMAESENPTLSGSEGDPSRTRATLLLRLKADGPARELAWDDFYKAYAPMISRLARYFGASRQQADEVLNDVLSKFFAAQPHFVYEPQQGRFRSYLKQCTRYSTIDMLRQHKRIQDAPVGGENEALINVPDADAEPVERAWERIWEDQLLRRAIEATRARYSSNEARRRTFLAFENYVLLGKEASVVAQELELSLDGVHQARSRVSRALKEELEVLQAEYEG
jgi:RNA polymerase sigma factor (sigma-70 family)